MLTQLDTLFDIPNVQNYFFDMYGVLWNGKQLYDGVDDVLMLLRQQGKKVYILTNQTALQQAFVETRQKQGLICGVHYDDVITSGDVCLQAFQDGICEQVTQKNDYRLFVLGLSNPALTNAVSSHLTDNPDEADIFYISSLYGDTFQTLEQVFIPVMQKGLEKNLPIICANPDVYVMHGNDKILAQGAAAKWYQELGGCVYFFGKPEGITFQYALKRTQSTVSNSVMVGDMLMTDILGANGVGMPTVLVTQTGMTDYDMRSQHLSLTDFITQQAHQENKPVTLLTPTYVLPQVGKAFQNK